MNRLPLNFYQHDVLEIAPELLGRVLVRKTDNQLYRYKITEVEAYRGEEDLACHASKGRTMRTEIMYHNGGVLYIYLIYGMYWMLNVVTGLNNNPQAVLIRGIEGINGPGRVTKALNIDKSFYGENLFFSNRIWIEKNEGNSCYYTTPRIGINYAGEIWKNKPWRFVLDNI
ncbi:MAG: DNA-3-methyladenine glycosylase [Chlorobi bacterium]|nr:DNA-3-methyladenine glycosylase [Chlorobiota bacterium]